MTFSSFASHLEVIFDWFNNNRSKNGLIHSNPIKPSNMKTRLSQLATLTASVIALSALTASAKPPKDGAGPGKGKGRKADVMAKFDVDGDGQLSESERAAAQAAGGERRKQAAAMKQEMLEKHDADGDGKLSDKERLTAFRARLAADATLNERVLAKHDTDKDGTLSDDELGKVRKKRGDDKRGPRKALKRRAKGGKKGKGKKTN